MGFNLNIDDREILARRRADHGPDCSSVFSAKVRLRDPALKAVCPKTIRARSVRNSGRAHGHTTARFGRDCERDEAQERGDQECHKNTDRSPMSLIPGGWSRQAGWQ